MFYCLLTRPTNALYIYNIFIFRKYIMFYCLIPRSTNAQYIYIYINNIFIFRKYSYMFQYICIIFSGSPLDGADASQYVGLLKKYKNIITIHISCAFFGLDNKLHKTRGT